MMSMSDQHCVGDEEPLSVEQCKAWWQKKVSEGYFTAFSFGFSHPHLIESLHLGKDSCILEIGCGYGRETSQFIKLSDHVWAVDLSDAALELTRRHAPSVHTVPYDGWTLPFPNPLCDSDFDLVYGCFVIQHMSKRAALRVFAESLRVLKPGGSVLFEFFECGHYSSTKGNCLSGGSMYNNSYTLEEAKAAIRTDGGEVKSVHTVPYGVLPSETLPTFNHWIEFGRRKPGG